MFRCPFSTVSYLVRHCIVNKDKEGRSSAFSAYSAPPLRRCGCGPGWTEDPATGECAEARAAAGEASEAVAAVVLPSLLLAALILLLSLCACVHVHKGNRALHRELRQEYSRNQDKYAAASSPGPDTAADTRPSDTEVRIENHEHSGDSEEADTGAGQPQPRPAQLPPPPPRPAPAPSPSPSPLSPPRPAAAPAATTPRTASALSVRSLEQSRKQSGLHPLHGLIQPTGLVPQPQAGYQASMRLLFRQRPASAVSLGADTAATTFSLRSRPASAISRLDTVPAVFTEAPASDSDEEIETEFGNSMEGLKPAYKSDVSVNESLKRFSKNNHANYTNGALKNGSVKMGILKTSNNRKTSDADSENSISHKSSVSSTSSVRFATNIEQSNYKLKDREVSSSSASSTNSVSSRRTVTRQLSSTSVSSVPAPAAAGGETLMEKVLRERSARNIKRKVETPKPFSGHANATPAKSILKTTSGNKVRKKKRSIIFASPEKEKVKQTAVSSAGSTNYAYAMEADENSDSVTWVKVMVHK